METINLHDITRALIKINDDRMDLIKVASELKRFQGRKVRLTNDKGTIVVGFYNKSVIKSSILSPHEIYILFYLQSARKDGTPSMKSTVISNPTKMEILD